MKYLVSCPCGHALDRHEAASGCLGDGHSRDCSCARGPDEALDAAVLAVRSDPDAWQTTATSAVQEAS